MNIHILLPTFRYDMDFPTIMDLPNVRPSNDRATAASIGHLLWAGSAEAQQPIGLARVVSAVHVVGQSLTCLA